MRKVGWGERMSTTFFSPWVNFSAACLQAPGGIPAVVVTEYLGSGLKSPEPCQFKKHNLKKVQNLLNICMWVSSTISWIRVVNEAWYFNKTMELSWMKQKQICFINIIHTMAVLWPLCSSEADFHHLVENARSLSEHTSILTPGFYCIQVLFGIFHEKAT